MFDYYLVGNVQFVVGKDDGELTCFNTFSQLWKLRLKDLHNNVSQLLHYKH